MVSEIVNMDKLKDFQKIFPRYIIAEVKDSEGWLGDREFLRWGFPNGFGVSVACHAGTYNGEPELAVIGSDGRIVYDTGITEDVIPCIKAHEALVRIEQVKRLQPKPEEEAWSDEPIGI